LQNAIYASDRHVYLQKNRRVQSLAEDVEPVAHLVTIVCD
jgi:hypothetical protein